MSVTVEASNVRKELEKAREQRTQITRGAPLPIDTAHVVGACPKCGHLGATILGFPDPPYAGPQGKPRYRNAKELLGFVEEIFRNPPPLPGQGDPADPPKNPQQAPNWKGYCVCGADVMPPQPDPNTGEMLESPDATPRLVCGVRFLKAMPGSGAELVVEALAAGDGGVGWEKGVSIGWKLLRAPVDGNETEVANALEDDAIEKNFGRPLTLAHTWSRVLSKAATGEELIEKVDAGYWIWAGPKENKVLDDEIKKLIGEDAEKGSFPLMAIPQLAPMPQGPFFAQWAYEHGEAIQKGDLRAGVIIDRAAVRKLVETQLGRANLQWREVENGALILAQAGELTWPMETAIVSLGAAHLGWYFSETAAAAVGECMARLTELQRWVAAVRQERPEMTFTINGMQIAGKRQDGTMGRPINLQDLPFRAPPGSPDFRRELRFACDDLPKNADPTRRCPCGERAWLAARIFPSKVVEDFKSATGGKSPKIIEHWDSAALVATISCDRHVRVPAGEEIEGAGLKDAAFDKRLKEDLQFNVFAVDVSLHEDKAKRRALLAYGPLVASVVINDHFIAKLHQMCVLPDKTLPLRGKEVSAVVTTPNVLCLHEAGFDDEMLEQVLDMGAAMDGIPADVPMPFDLSWDVTLTAEPKGNFVNLRPPPPGQGGAQPQPQPQGGARR
ncbi:MAG: hypothetical protein U0325_27645 [Polyangiales bacterium]